MEHLSLGEGIYERQERKKFAFAELTQPNVPENLFNNFAATSSRAWFVNNI